MAYVAVESTNIAGVEYTKADKTLDVTFHSGSVYTYYDVPAIVYKELIEAESVGKFFNKYIKNSYIWDLQN